MMERASYFDETSYEEMPTEARVSEVTSTGLVRIIFTRDVLFTDDFSSFIAENKDEVRMLTQNSEYVEVFLDALGEESAGALVKGWKIMRADEHEMTIKLEFEDPM